MEAKNTTICDVKLKVKEAQARVAEDLKGDLPTRLVAVSESRVLVR
ncbi:hypothetical protein [Streptococcus uberis]|nr:hypothetical protein [Streptococcus uberis]MCK1168310.1 hypothetical protein [Streptococcus uberis]MCK1187242.1 hypothetical protein [Streptococcus uberis]MCK1242992.1 hypothetical protein [Streptococcus uberis]MCK1244468.1 hypothetical protein [Streptococcus uberis]MCK1256436.1 hypothetical protein [Streptococcus uberis]